MSFPPFPEQWPPGWVYPPPQQQTDSPFPVQQVLPSLSSIPNCQDQRTGRQFESVVVEQFYVRYSSGPFPSYPVQEPLCPAYPSGPPEYPARVSYPIEVYAVLPEQQDSFVDVRVAPISDSLLFPSEQNEQVAVAMEEYEPSVYPHELFDARADAEVLHKAMKGWGTDEKGLINVLCRRTGTQRVQIVHAYKASYGKDLEAKIKSETSGNFERVLVGLVRSRAEFLAHELHRAMNGLGTKESTLIEVLCSSTNQEIRDINQAYQTIYGRSLESDITGDTSGTFESLLISLVQGERDEDTAVDYRKVKEDARLLYDAGEGKFGTDEGTFNCIFAARSWAHLKQLMEEYKATNGHSLEEAVASEFSFNAERGLLAILECARNRPAFYAQRLHKAIKGLGTKDDILIRVIVSRSDIDLVSIKREYMQIYGRTLQEDVAGDTSGDYKHALLMLIGF